MTKIENEIEFMQTIRELKKTKVWRGTIDERKQKFIETHAKLNALYGKNIRLEFIEVSALNDNIQGASGRSFYSPLFNAIIIHKKLSVITFIFLWLRALDQDSDPREQLETANNIFKEVFPVSAKKLIVINNLSVQASETENDPNNDPMFNGNDSGTDVPPSL